VSGSEYPAELAASSDADAPRYYRADDGFALHGAPPAGAGVDVVATLEPSGIRLCRGRPPAGGVAGRTVTPVYSLERSGPPCAPSGQVFVRFAAGVDARRRVEDLAAAGYRIRSVPGYAPHAAWVEAERGGIPAALAGVAELARLPDVERVEPQLLKPARRR